MALHDLRGRAFARGGGAVHRKDEIHVSQKFGLLMRTGRAESGILYVPSAIFQELHNFMFLSLCTLRIDKSIRNMYNKARNQRSTAEAQERATPADLKQKGARPMVDMEPAQFGQTVGIR